MEQIADTLRQSLRLIKEIISDQQMHSVLAEIVEVCSTSLKSGGQVLFCGNGGSAADAQHLAAELSGRFYYDRPPLNAEALHVNTSYLTAVGNDYGYEFVYERLIRGKGKAGDVLVGISTSGNSPNIIKALECANSKQMLTVGMTGKGGGKMKPLCNYLLAVPSSDTPRIQEIHILLGHIICELIEIKLFPHNI